MNARKLFGLIVVIVLVTLALVNVTSAQGPRPGTRAPRGALTTAFTYQGQLKQSGTLYTGSCDFQFGLWDDVSVGTQHGITQTATAVSVNSGLFTTPIDFGAGMFDGNRRWLAIAVRCPTATGNYTPLTTRQELTATPYAFFSNGAPWSGLSNIPSPITFLANPSPCSSGQVASWNGTTWTCSAVALPPAFQSTFNGSYADTTQQVLTTLTTTTGSSVIYEFGTDYVLQSLTNGTATTLWMRLYVDGGFQDEVDANLSNSPGVSTNSASTVNRVGRMAETPGTHVFSTTVQSSNGNAYVGTGYILLLQR